MFMFTLVLSNIFIQLQFNLHCNDIYYNYNVNVRVAFCNNYYFRVSFPYYELFLMVTCRRKVLKG